MYSSLPEARKLLRIFYVQIGLQRIVITNGDKKFVFKAATIEETSEWVKKLNDAIHISEGYGKNLTYLAHYPRFWRVFPFIARKTTKARLNLEGQCKQETSYCLEAQRIHQ